MKIGLFTGEQMNKQHIFLKIWKIASDRLVQIPSHLHFFEKQVVDILLPETSKILLQFKDKALICFFMRSQFVYKFHMQNNKNRPPTFQPTNLNKFPYSRQPPLAHRQHSGHHSNSKLSPNNYNSPIQHPQTNNPSSTQFRQQILHNSHTSGFYTYSHRTNMEINNQFDAWKNTNNFQAQSFHVPNQNNIPPPYPRRNQQANPRQRKNSQVIYPTNFDFDFSANVQKQQNVSKKFQEQNGNFEANLGNKINGNKVDEIGRFKKPEIFQSMIMTTNENNRTSSGAKMKNSVICTNFSTLMPHSEKYRHNAPNLDSFKCPQPFKHPTLDKAQPQNIKMQSNNINLQEQKNYFKNEVKQGMPKQEPRKFNPQLKFSSIFTKNIEMKQSCFVGSSHQQYNHENFQKKSLLETEKGPKNQIGSPTNMFKKFQKSKETNSRGSTPTKNDSMPENIANSHMIMKKKNNYTFNEDDHSHHHHANLSQQPHFVKQKQPHRVPSQNLLKHLSPTHTNNIEFKKRSPQFGSTFLVEDSSKISDSDCIEFTIGEKSLVQQRKFSLDDFEEIEKLGKGAFGDVYLMQEKQSRMICVVKMLSKARIKQQNLQEHVLREIKIQSYLCHKHLVSLYGVFDDASKIYLIMQYLNDGTLSANKKKISEPETAYIVKQVLDGLNFMHCENIIHRDIKPENLFMYQSYVKIGDFGCSVFSNSLRKTVVGCLAYISPEQLNNSAYDQKIDVWSIGVLTYELLVGKSPFEADLKKMAKVDYQNRLTNDSDSGSLQGSQFPQLKFPQNSKISSQAEVFIKNLLEQDPEDRMTVKQALKHKFIQKSWEWEKLLEQKTQMI